MSLNTQRELCDTCGVDGWQSHKLGCDRSVGIIRTAPGTFDRLLKDYCAVEKELRIAHAQAVKAKSDGDTARDGVEAIEGQRHEAVNLGAALYRMLAANGGKPA